MRRLASHLLVGLLLVLGSAACGEDSADGDGNGNGTSAWPELTATCEVTGAPASESEGAIDAGEGVDGVLAFGTQSQEHVDECVDYEVSPPVGGAHHRIWANCGFYDEPVPAMHAVHSMEHGAVWIAYGEEADRATLDAIRLATSRSTHVLASLYPDLGTSVVLSAWSRQLTLESVDDERFEDFLDLYVQGPQTPELGASCEGALGQPA